MKNSILIIIVVLAVGIVLLEVFYTSGRTETASTVGQAQTTVYYSSTCGCCGNYISYLRNAGFSVNAKQTQDMDAVKTEFGIPIEMMSCHTSIIGGYVVEGHMPAAVIQKLLEEKTDVKGIALPGMPHGSPGMGGKKDEIWKIYELGGQAGKVFMEI